MTNRRSFIRKTILGAGLFGSGLVSCDVKQTGRDKSGIDKKHVQRFNMCGYAAPRLETVRVGFIGVGARGSEAVKRLSHIEGVEIISLCDIDPKRVMQSQQTLENRGMPPAKAVTGSDEAWKSVCEDPDINLVYICTPWKQHTPQAVYAMEHGKHVAVEVPAAVTVDECWNLVETSERTQKHCMMLENVCYGFFELLTINMARQGFFGDIVHCEGAYIHHLPGLLFKNSPGNWRLQEITRNGNLYPTHGLGPLCQIMNINRGDKMEYLNSMQSADFSTLVTIKEKSVEDPFFREFTEKKFAGNMNTSLVRTHKGRTILIQYDLTSPRPYSRIHLVSGTKGIAVQYPEQRVALGHTWFNETQMMEVKDKYTPDIVKFVGEMAKKVGGHGGMDFIMDWRLVDCLHNGLPLDQDVYDAALWSVITPLSEWSVENRSNSVDVPDFTCGSWQTNLPVDIGLRDGGTTRFRN